MNRRCKIDGFYDKAETKNGCFCDKTERNMTITEKGIFAFI